MAKSKTNEQALESSIEKALVGISREELEAGGVMDEAMPTYGNRTHFNMGFNHDFNKEYAIDEKWFWHFLESTQSEELDKLKRDPQYKLKIIQRLDRMIKKYGVVKVLRKGLDVDDAHFTLMYVAPLASSALTVRKRFYSNVFSVTRQVTYSMANPREEIDMVIFVNGIPIITMELKNPWTGQNARVHGQKQYKQDRDATQPLLRFGRCIVHFAVDTDEVYMTTKLAGKKTFFRPFNKGYNSGKGNPPNPHGHNPASLWEEV
jgi:type I restriction enzyme R subunit